jgi:hypothetical protein
MAPMVRGVFEESGLKKNHDKLEGIQFLSETGLKFIGSENEEIVN